MSNSTDGGGDQLILPSLDLHFNSMPFIWSIAIDLTIFLAFYKYRPYAQWLHVLGGMICISLTLATSLPTLLDLQELTLDDPDFYHYIIGIIIYVVMFFQIVLGGLSRTSKTLLKSIHIYRINKLHMILGYFLALLGKIQVMTILDNVYKDDIYQAHYEYHAFIFNVFWNIILVALYIWRKNTRKTLQQSLLPLKFEQKILEIQGLDELNGNLYIVFANYVYEMEVLSRDHPIGYQVIKTVKGRSVDRFLYGMYTSEKTPSLPNHSHSLRSLALLDRPIAKIVIPQVYDNFNDEMLNVKLSQTKMISELSMIYQITLQPIGSHKLQFMGYTKKSQLGRHYALTLNKKITRLYTYVHFLQPKNLSLLIRIAPHKIKQITHLQKYQNLSEISDVRLPPSEQEVNNVEQAQSLIAESSPASIPLLIKKYDKGKMTGELLNDKVNSLHISIGRGEGLKLRNVTRGKFCIIAGGTGLFPFCDLIDLLYKEKIMNKVPEHANQIIKNSPILADHPFQNISFVLLLAVVSIADIHPITLMQIQELASEEYFQVTMKVRVSANFDNHLNNIKLVSQPFEQIIESLTNETKITKFWICGPPRMNESMARFFKRMKMKNYRFL